MVHPIAEATMVVLTLESLLGKKLELRLVQVVFLVDAVELAVVFKYLLTVVTVLDIVLGVTEGVRRGEAFAVVMG